MIGLLARPASGPSLARWRAIVALFALAFAGNAVAAAPLLLRTANYESPVRADPDDLLLIPGYGFHTGDRVVYQAVGAASDSGKHPDSVPKTSNATLGTATVVRSGSPAYAMTVRLPEEISPHTIYRLWVVNAGGEWSEPVSINDPRPLWISPAYVYATADVAHTNRRVRVIGRNLEPENSDSVRIRLEGRKTYLLTAEAPAADSTALRHYVAEAPLPAQMEPGAYAVSVSRGDLGWVRLADQRLEVRADPVAARHFDLSDSQFGECRADDEADDSVCLARAIEAAARAGGGVVDVPAGTWDLTATRAGGANSIDGFVLPRNVHLRGAGAKATFIVRHRGAESGSAGALLTLTGANSVSGLAFADAERIESMQDIKAVIQLGIPWDRPGTLRTNGAVRATGMEGAVDDIVISDNTFRRVGRAVVDSGRPMSHLFITRNEFSAYETALSMPGDRFNVAQPYRVDDAVIRWNRFVPGSYVDLTAHQGTIGSGLGASHRVDFSSNVADGASSEGLQSPQDQHGFRAAFFWNVNGDH
ncbi:MAG: hypothetical protein ABI885_20575, partial [Gammaproteobacteria bacterium]